MSCGFKNIHKRKMHENNNIKARREEMEVYCSKIFINICKTV